LGQRLLATDEGEFPLMDVREVKLVAASVSVAG
jgi:protein involved in temperature-dependent protein secretion